MLQWKGLLGTNTSLLQAYVNYGRKRFITLDQGAAGRFTNSSDLSGIRALETTGASVIKPSSLTAQIKGPVNMYRVISVDFRRYPFLVLIHLNMLKQVPNPLLGLALALASILTPNN